MLEQIAHPPPLGRQINMGGAVKEHLAIQDDAPPVRPLDTGNAFKGQALAAARGTQQSQRLSLRAEGRLQMEAAIGFSTSTSSAIYLTPFPGEGFSRRSSIFTASSTTAEIAMFTNTQRKARASFPVRQS